MLRAQTFEVLEHDDPVQHDRWLRHWRATDERDPHAHPTHVDLFSAPEDSARCAVLTWQGGSVLLPFVLRPIDGTPHHDVTSPYGYGGPFASGDTSPNCREQFWAEFDRWLSEHDVVSEFLRFSTTGAGDAPVYPGAVTFRSTTVVRSLDLDQEALWMDFDHKVRKSVNKARRSGVEVSVDTTGDRLDEFLEIYEGTMNRRGAHDRYLFPRTFFERICKEMSGSYVFFHADVEGVMVSTELVLVGNEVLYSYLGGTNEDAFSLRPNDLLKFTVMTWGAEHEKREFVLGGGANPGDGIERYKLSFAPGGARPFFTGERVLDPTVYDELSASAPQGEGAFFPAYRRTAS